VSKTKLQLVQLAFEEIGLPYYNFDLQPEKLESALHRMDGMVAAWMERGLQLGYDFGAGLNDDSGVALSDELAIYMNLAVSIAPGLGKMPSPETKSAAATSMDSMFIRAAQPEQQQMPASMPRGEGQKPWRSTYYPFFPRPDTSPLRAPQTDNLDIAKD
jgi:hypothetical protein